MERICEHCNKKFEGYSNKKYCSKRCKSNAQYHRDKKEKIGNIKICKHCNKEFISKSGSQKYCCRLCGRKHYRINNKEKLDKYNKEYRIKNPNKKREYDLKKNYNISKETFDEIFIHIQKRKCMICGKPLEKYHVDHNHKTNEFRGLLCPSCNWGLGNFKDNPLNLIRAAKYLKGERYRNI